MSHASVWRIGSGRMKIQSTEDKLSMNSQSIIQSWQSNKIADVFVIAEIGINHNGDLDIAKRMIDLARESGCDVVKFQKRTLEIVYSQEFLDSPRESPFGETQRDQKEALEFGETEYVEIDRYCRETGIEWFASAWDLESLEFLNKFDLKYNKVASAMLTNEPFLKAVAAERKLTFISTGMSNYKDIDKSVEIFEEANCCYILMHCVSTYPSPESDLNLKMIKTLRDRYGCLVGYSGHEPSVSPSVIASVLGAVAIERHITLDRAMYGSDQAASLEKAGLESLVTQVRKVNVVMGDGVKRITPGEVEVLEKLRYW